MKKPPFNTNYPKPVEKIHIPNKIETNLEGFEKENFYDTLKEFQKLIPNPRVKIGIDFIDDIFKDGVNKKDVAKVFGNICTPSSCPFTYYCFTNNESVTCSKCGKIVRGNLPTY